LFVGVLAPIKRPADLLLAHERLQVTFPGLKTTFCGPIEDSAYARAMQTTIAQRSIRGVEFLGAVPRDRMTELLATATALVLPSAQENTPMVIAEAMAVGIPVVATRVGAVGEMIDHGQNGLLYPPGNVGALTSSLQLLLADPGLRQRIGSRATAWAANTCAPERVGAATVAVYRELLGMPPGLAMQRHGNQAARLAPKES
jgi:glycosyltransferase involved in cell wall biosynthesis